MSSNTYILALTGSSGGNLAPNTGGRGDYFYSPTTYSYQCTKCGMYVYYGTTHWCSYNNVWSIPVYVYPTVPANTKELEDKLDELTDEVKKLRKELQKKK